MDNRHEKKEQISDIISKAEIAKPLNYKNAADILAVISTKSITETATYFEILATVPLTSIVEKIKDDINNNKFPLLDFFQAIEKLVSEANERAGQIAREKKANKNITDEKELLLAKHEIASDAITHQIASLVTCDNIKLGEMLAKLDLLHDAVVDNITEKPEIEMLLAAEINCIHQLRKFFEEQQRSKLLTEKNPLLIEATDNVTKKIKNLAQKESKIEKELREKNSPDKPRDADLENEIKRLQAELQITKKEYQNLKSIQQSLKEEYTMITNQCGDEKNVFIQTLKKEMHKNTGTSPLTPINSRLSSFFLTSKKSLADIKLKKPTSDGDNPSPKSPNKSPRT